MQSLALTKSKYKIDSKRKLDLNSSVLTKAERLSNQYDVSLL
jgi:hypothetical protein